MYQRFFKRPLDLFASTVCLVVLSPLLLLIAILIKRDSEGTVCFRQKRVGMGKKLFWIYKFRTMASNTPDNIPTNDFQDPHKYITKLGHFLRKSSLDELPQLLNIVRGEMSFIGPRPALYNQYDLVEKRDLVGANDIRPGLSGWAQVNGRDELGEDLDQKARLDGYYTSHVTFLFDMKCLLWTFVKVFNHQGNVEGKQNREGQS